MGEAENTFRVSASPAVSRVKEYSALPDLTRLRSGFPRFDGTMLLTAEATYQGT